jgi:hypothetical protein
MKGDEIVWDCLRKHGTDEDAWDCIRHCGADANLQKVLREFGAGEELEQVLREGDAQRTQRKARQILCKFAMDRAMEKARQNKATLDSITESSVWKDPRFLGELSRRFLAKDLAKSRETTKHYIDNTGQPARTPNISEMGSPKLGTDGRVMRDAEGEVIWEVSGQSKTPYRPNVMADGRINPNVSMMGRPKLGLDGQVTWEVNDEPTPRPVNVRADGKIDATKSLMGTPKLNPDGSITWM